MSQETHEIRKTQCPGLQGDPVNLPRILLELSFKSHVPLGDVHYVLVCIPVAEGENLRPHKTIIDTTIFCSQIMEDNLMAHRIMLHYDLHLQ